MQGARGIYLWPKCVPSAPLRATSSGTVLSTWHAIRKCLGLRGRRESMPGRICASGETFTLENASDNGKIYMNRMARPAPYLEKFLYTAGTVFPVVSVPRNEATGREKQRRSACD